MSYPKALARTDADLISVRSLLRLPTVIQATGLGRSTIYKLVAEKKFPAPVKLTGRAVAWRRGDIERWTEERPVASH
jgi:prophage regulatory protein